MADSGDYHGRTLSGPSLCGRQEKRRKVGSASTPNFTARMSIRRLPAVPRNYPPRAGEAVPGVSVSVLPESASGTSTPNTERSSVTRSKTSIWWLMRTRSSRRCRLRQCHGGALRGGCTRRLSRENAGARFDVATLVRLDRLGRGSKGAFFANSVVDFTGTLIALLICHEQLLIWPILQSALRFPELIVATESGWRAEGSSIAAGQRATTISWAWLSTFPWSCLQHLTEAARVHKVSTDWQKRPGGIERQAYEQASDFGRSPGLFGAPQMSLTMRFDQFPGNRRRNVRQSLPHLLK